jgi:hypothetical protein
LVRGQIDERESGLNLVRDYPALPDGRHNGIVADVIDLGDALVDLAWEKRTVHRCLFVWLILDERCIQTHRPYRASLRMNVSLHPDSTMYNVIHLITGAPPRTDVPFDLDILIGRSNLLLTKHKRLDDGRLVANVLKIGPPIKVFPRVPGWFRRSQDRQRIRSAA